MATKKNQPETDETLSDKNLQIMLHTASELVAGKQRDLSMRQLAVLLHCARSGINQTVRGLAARLKISKPAITRAADRLQSDGLATRKPDPADRRSVFIVVTPKGRSFLREMSRIISDASSAS